MDVASSNRGDTGAFGSIAPAAIPAGLAVAPVAHVWANNPGQVETSMALVAAAGAAAIGTAVYALVRVVFVRDAAGASFVAGIGVGALWSGAWLVGRSGLDPASAVGIAATWGVFAVALFGGTWAARHIAGDAPARVLAVGCVVLLLISGARLAFSLPGGAAAHGAAGLPEQTLTGLPPIPEPVPPPARDAPEHADIYYIVLDGYARQDVLRDAFGHDNEPFLQALRDRGFFVAQQSVANYLRTFLSLTSSLNASHLGPLAEAEGPDGRSRRRAYAWLRAPWVARYLQARGYRFVQLMTNWGGTEQSDVADERLAYRSRLLRSEFVGVLLNPSAFRFLRPGLADYHRNSLDVIAPVAEISGPTFLFAHVLLPHDPYVFDEDGRETHHVPLYRRQDGATKRTTSGSDPVAAYRGQLRYLNGRLLGIVDAILEKSSVPPVVILQGDHGWRPPAPAGASELETVRHTVRTRGPILNALLVPDAVRRRLDPGITPVNTFRVLLAELFGAPLERLPDRSYYSGYAEPYRLVDVTATLSPDRAANRMR